MHCSSQSELSLKLGMGASILNEYNSNSLIHSSNGFLHQYDVSLTFPISNKLSFVPAMGIQFHNFSNYAKDSNGIVLNTPLKNLNINYLTASLFARYQIKKWSVDIGFVGHYMLNKNLLFIEGIIIDRIVYIYPFEFSDRYQNSINLGVNWEWNRLRIGFHYERMLDHLFDTKGYEINKPRSFINMQSFKLNIELIFKSKR